MKKIILVTMVCITLSTQASTLYWHLEGWYPTDKTELVKNLKELDAQAAKQFYAPADQHIRAIIVPHAGYQYSGTVATAVYRMLDKKAYNKVIILCPAHQRMLKGIAIPEFTSYTTPLGSVAVAVSLVKKLNAQSPFVEDPLSFETEHSMEIQLPFLQHYLSKFKIVPLIVGDITHEDLDAAVKALEDIIDEHTLVVVSSDFTHYGPRYQYTPFGNYQPWRVKRLDNQALAYIQNENAAGFAQFIAQTNDTICGQHAIEMLLSLIGRDVFDRVEPRVIAYATSAAQLDTSSDSVSYAGVTFTTQPWRDLKLEDQFNQFEQTALLEWARTCLDNLFNQKISLPQYAPIITRALFSKHGAFVTLKTSDGQLRGCIGHITSNQPLYQTIAQLVREAALHDKRFAPVTQAEIAQLRIELSILNKPQEVESYEDIKLGTDGIILHYNDYSAVYLPEVATEQKWNLAQTLESLSKKAGLHTTAWQDPAATFEVFQSLKIS